METHSRSALGLARSLRGLALLGILGGCREATPPVTPEPVGGQKFALTKVWVTTPHPSHPGGPTARDTITNANLEPKGGWYMWFILDPRGHVYGDGRVAVTIWNPPDSSGVRTGRGYWIWTGRLGNHWVQDGPNVVRLSLDFWFKGGLSWVDGSALSVVRGSDGRIVALRLAYGVYVSDVGPRDTVDVTWHRQGE